MNAAELDEMRATAERQARLEASWEDEARRQGAVLTSEADRLRVHLAGVLRDEETQVRRWDFVLERLQFEEWRQGLHTETIARLEQDVNDATTAAERKKRTGKLQRFKKGHEAEHKKWEDWHRDASNDITGDVAELALWRASIEARLAEIDGGN